MRRSLTRTVLTLTVAAVAVPLLSLGSTASAAPCIPSWTGYGPVVTVDVDYNNPANSEVGYNSSAFSLQFDLCVI